MSKKKSTNSTSTSSEPKPVATVSPATSPAASHPQTSGHFRRWAIGSGLVVGAGLVIIGVIAGMAFLSADRVMAKNVTIGGVNVGGMNTLTALNVLQERWKVFTDHGFVFQTASGSIKVPVTGGAGTSDEVILDLAEFDIRRSVDLAYDFGHEGAWWQQLEQRLSGLVGRRHEFGKFALSTDGLREYLKQQLKADSSLPTNAGLLVNASGEATLTPSKAGVTFDYEPVVHRAVLHLRSLTTATIALSKVSVGPTISSTPALQHIADTEVPEILQQAPIKLTFSPNQNSRLLKDGALTIDQRQLGKLLGFAAVNGQVKVGFDQQKTSDYLTTTKKDTDIPPLDAKFSIDNGTVKEFQASVVGKTLDVAATLAAMNAQFIERGQTTVAAVVKEEKPTTDTVGANNLGIKELVAEGRTSFRGSPTNRRFNLTLGSTKLNGLLIKPGGTFSLVTSLGPIDGAHGWKPELVIKQGGRITPEFGGGLCQVATTLFRAALNTGLPIVDRTNHSLRISYYEPPIGLDATIYEPKPDLRFTNDYPGYLLLQTEVAGDNLVYRFYGTKDGRSTDIPTPKVFNQKPIPAPKTIEVTDLKPGQKECQSPGHPGADAIATYTVTKADGQKVVQTFTSHYRPIGVICRVGKAKEVKASSPKKTEVPVADTNTDIEVTETE